MNKLSCAAVLLALGVSGAVSADEAGASSSARANHYWHCVYLADSGMGGVYEVEQRGTCRTSIDHPFFGPMTLFEAYPG